jgi:hypothetical protein
VTVGPDDALRALDVTGPRRPRPTSRRRRKLSTVSSYSTPAGTVATYAAEVILAQRESRLVGVEMSGAIVDRAAVATVNALPRRSVIQLAGSVPLARGFRRAAISR